MYSSCIYPEEPWKLQKSTVKITGSHIIMRYGGEGSEGIALLILNVCTGGRLVVSFKFLPLYNRYPLYRPLDCNGR